MRATQVTVSEICLLGGCQRGAPCGLVPPPLSARPPGGEDQLLTLEGLQGGAGHSDSPCSWSSASCGPVGPPSGQGQQAHRTAGLRPRCPFGFMNEESGFDLC